MAGYSRRDEGNIDCRVYVGNLPPSVREKDLTDMFYKYGDITNIDLKRSANGMGNPFAFVEFRDKRDADDAKAGKDGADLDGYTLRVQYPRAGGRGGFRGGFSDRGGFSERGGRGRGGGGFGNSRPKGPPPRRSNYRCFVSGLPPSGSWQDLKDHMREAGDVCFTDVYNDGTGVVEFLRREDMEYACSRLNYSKFRSHEEESATLRVKADNPEPMPGRSRSPSPPRRGRGGYSPPPPYQSNNYHPRSRSRSRSRHRSYTRSRSRD